jgi:hypothetical protein
MPIPVADLDIDLAGRIVGAQEHGRLLAATFPPDHRVAIAVGTSRRAFVHVMTLLSVMKMRTD